MTGGQRSDFEVIRDALAQLDPETREQVIEVMRLLPALPRPVAIRVLVDAGRRYRLRNLLVNLN